jgi:hypothetical protein
MILTTSATFMYGRETSLQDYTVATAHMRLQSQQGLAQLRLPQLRDLERRIAICLPVLMLPIQRSVEHGKVA